MELYWWEQTEADVPSDGRWLSEWELAKRSSLKIAKRRTDWLLGRWTAKCAASTLTRDTPFHEIEIRPAATGAPYIYVRGQPAAMTVSISHRGGVGCCALIPSHVTLGCDLEVAEARSARFLSDYFTEPEQELVVGSGPASRDAVAALIWSAKESALKALQVGMRWDTRSVQVSGHFTGALLQTDGWHMLKVFHPNGEFRGWWNADGRFVRTVVSGPFAPPPLCMESRLATREN